MVNHCSWSKAKFDLGVHIAALLFADICIKVIYNCNLYLDHNICNKIVQYSKIVTYVNCSILCWCITV